MNKRASWKQLSNLRSVAQLWRPLLRKSTLTRAGVNAPESNASPLDPNGRERALKHLGSRQHG